jgi:hypothetical protein
LFVLVYILSLATSSGLIVLFARHLLASEGGVSGFSESVLLAFGLACLYMAVQLLYVALIQFLYPTRARGPLFTETLSHGCTLVLSVKLAGIQLPWPHDLLAQYESLVLITLFFCAHAFFKLLTLFSATQSSPSSGLDGYVWLAAGALCVFGGFWSFTTWQNPNSTESYRDLLWQQVERLNDQSKKL